MLDGLEVLELTERDEDGMSGAGPKHWHVFDVLAAAARARARPLIRGPRR